MIVHCGSIHDRVTRNMRGQEDEEKQESLDLIQKQEEMQVSICKIIGVLFKTHTTMSLPFANYLIQTVVQTIFVPTQSVEITMFGIFLINYMVDYLGYEMLIPHWAQFPTILLRYMKMEDCKLRRAVNSGMGVLASKTPSSVLNA